MAIKRIDLSGPIKRWKDARKGKEVRAANVEAFEQIQTVVNDSIDGVNQAAKNVENVALDTSQVAKSAAETVVRANQTVDHADDILDGATAQARYSGESAKLSESWAHGGTGSRAGENTNNSEYYSKQAETAASNATAEADRAAQYSKIIAPGFYFDPSVSSLFIKKGVGVDFKVSESRLYWKVT